MEARAKIFGHPIHQMLIVFPLGLLLTAFIFDLVYFISGDNDWAGHSYVMIAAGIIGGLVAAVFGVIDWKAIPAGTRAKRIGTYHGLSNVFVLALFAASWQLRQQAADNAPSFAACMLAAAGVAVSGLSGWLGGELVSRLGVGVDDDAHLDAHNSLKQGRKA